MTTTSHEKNLSIKDKKQILRTILSYAGGIDTDLEEFLAHLKRNNYGKHTPLSDILADMVESHG